MHVGGIGRIDVDLFTHNCGSAAILCDKELPHLRIHPQTHTHTQRERGNVRHSREQHDNKRIMKTEGICVRGGARGRLRTASLTPL